MNRAIDRLQVISGMPIQSLCRLPPKILHNEYVPVGWSEANLPKIVIMWLTNEVPKVTQPSFGTPCIRYRMINTF